MSDQAVKAIAKTKYSRRQRSSSHTSSSRLAALIAQMRSLLGLTSSLDERHVCVEETNALLLHHLQENEAQ